MSQPPRNRRFPQGSRRPASTLASTRRPRPTARPARPWAVLALLAVTLGGGALWALLRPDARPRFSGERALELIERQVEFGPRIPGSEGHARQLDWMVETLRPLADTVQVQPVTFSAGGDTVSGANVVASFNPGARTRVMLAAHWDTRPVADRDPDPARRSRPVPGANDGASGVAVLLEMAALMAERPPERVGVDLVLFDLEDLGELAGTDGDTVGPDLPFAIGSRAFVRQNVQQDEGYRPSYGVLLDMVCDRDLRIPQEGYSRANARDVVRRVWAAARRAEATAFLNEGGDSVQDDHVPFLEAGIPVVDLIHLPFPATWHTTRDTPGACSAESLDQVGETLVELLYGRETNG